MQVQTLFLHKPCSGARFCANLRFASKVCASFVQTLFESISPFGSPVQVQQEGYALVANRSLCLLAKTSFLHQLCFCTKLCKNFACLQKLRLVQKLCFCKHKLRLCTKLFLHRFCTVSASKEERFRLQELRLLELSSCLLACLNLNRVRFRQNHLNRIQVAKRNFSSSFRF